jgi:hypothetical protein
MTAFWSGTAPEFLAADPAPLLHRLAHEQARRFTTNRETQLYAWDTTLRLLRDALLALPAGMPCRVLLEFPLLRLGRRIDVVLVTDRAIVVLEFKVGATQADRDAREQAEDDALDLQDFHAGSRRHPIIPIVVATGSRDAPSVLPLPIAAVSAVQVASARSLPRRLHALLAAIPDPSVPLDPLAWEAAPYRPVPPIVDAACTLYARHGVEDLAAARADAGNLTQTTQAILHAVAEAQRDGVHLAVFVTGTPGAGKTLCGLNAVFGAGRAAGATFLTGNPSLVHVLREALARDSAGPARGALRAARQRVESAIQLLPLFRDHHVGTGDIPAEHVAVIDEAQRSWSAEHAIRKTRDRSVRLADSEPGHLLDAMGRHPDWAAVICLVGGGQEIHTGEGGLAEWGAALRRRPHWRVLAAPDTLSHADARQRLPALPGLRTDPALHLQVAVRHIRGAGASLWVDAVLQGDAAAARAIAGEAELPFRLTRDLGALRATLRLACRGRRRAGLVASSGAARLRAEGLGAELPHMDAGAVARWFLDRWPDVRASDALEVAATEFSCQGLELDHVGLCWGGDLAWQGRWHARSFRGTQWQALRAAEAVANRINTYRVLLTRARYSTTIWIPRGDPTDGTRPPAEMDAIATFLQTCGARLSDAASIPPAEPILLL